MSLLPPLLLLALSITDGGFAGFRDAAGRDPRIFKADLYRRAVRRGLRAGLAASALAAMVLAAVVFSAPSAEARLGELVVCARVMLPVLAVYATLVLAALGVWSAAEPDLRALASVTVLGPFTLIRPWVIAAAGALGAAFAPSVPAACGAVAACALQLAVGPWLARGWADGRTPYP